MKLSPLQRLCFAGIFVALGCSTPRGSAPPPLVSAQRYQGAEGDLPVVEQATWWKQFGDRRLNELVDQGLRANLELGEFRARLTQAEALARQASSSLFPTFDLAAGGERSRSTDLNGDGDDHQSRGVSLGGLLSWELDLWGRLRLGREAARRDAEAARADLENARRILVAAIVSNYFASVGENQQRSLLQEQIATNETLLELTLFRLGQGQASIVDVLQQREQLTATQALVPLTEEAIGQLALSRDVLLGRAPRPEPLEGREFPLLSIQYRAGVPSDLLMQRPDLVAIQQRLIALDHRAAQALAERWPRLSLTGSLTSLGRSSLDTLAGQIAADLIAPLFDAGLRKAELDRRRAALEEAFFDFSQQFLVAVQEVESALLQQRTQNEHLALRRKQLETAQRLLRESRNRYSQGLTDYLPVLSAVQSVQDLQRDVISQEEAVFQASILLHRALGNVG